MPEADMFKRPPSRRDAPPANPWRPQDHGRARRTLPWLTLVLAIAIFALPLLGENGLAMYFKLRGERDQIHREVQVLQAEADSLELAIDLLATDPTALERIARERYNMRRPQEQVLLLVKPVPAQAAP
jgi:cell division protein DivIC